MRTSAVLVAALAAAACTGTNLFSLTGTVSSGPTVDITAPEAGASLVTGESVHVTAQVTAPNGLSTAVFSGVYVADGSPAYRQQTLSFQNVGSASLDRTLAAVDLQEPGEVYVIVKVTDGQGESKADSVKVSVS